MDKTKARSRGGGCIKGITWLIWILTFIPSMLFVVLSLLTFEEVYTDVYNEQLEGETFRGVPVPQLVGDLNEDHRIWAILAVTIAAPCMVFVYFVYGTLVLIGKSVRLAGKSYTLGMLHAGLLWLTVLMMVTAVTVHGFYDRMNQYWEVLPEWSTRDTLIAGVTYVLAYVLALAYLALFVLLFFFGGCAGLLLKGTEDNDDHEEEHHSESFHHERSLKHDSPIHIHEHHDHVVDVKEPSHKEPKGVVAVPVSDANADRRGSERVIGGVVPAPVPAPQLPVEKKKPHVIF